MTQITVRVSDQLVDRLDRAARSLAKTRADVIHQALEHYLDDFEDLGLGLAALRDPGDPILEWSEVRKELLF